MHLLSFRYFCHLWVGPVKNPHKCHNQNEAGVFGLSSHQVLTFRVLVKREMAARRLESSSNSLFWLAERDGESTRAGSACRCCGCYTGAGFTTLFNCCCCLRILAMLSVYWLTNWLDRFIIT